MKAMIFPGQGSQKPGMGQQLATSSAAASSVFDRASSATGKDLRAICWELSEEDLRQTQNAQLALFVTSVAAFLAQEEEFQFAAGHSVGEYAALVCAGVLTVEDGAKLVQRRGELMASAGLLAPGTMAAVLGLDREPLAAVCESVSGVIVIANDNCPGQLVISGEVEAVKLASEKASEAGAKRVLPLNVSGAFHSPLMAGAAVRMREALDTVEFGAGEVPVVANVTAAVQSDNWAPILEQQLVSPVRWTESVQFMIAQGVTEFVELGGGEVLGGLIKRIDRAVSSRAFG